MWQDPEFFLGVLGAVPSIVNSLTQCVDEVLIQLNEKFSSQLLHEFIKSLVLSLDKKTLESIVSNGKPLVTALLQVAEEAYKTNTEGEEHGK
jgi:hypothetical protein